MTYYGWVRQLAGHFPDHHLPDLPPERVLDFLIHLQDDRKLKASTLNQAVCALRTLYRDHLGYGWDIWKKNSPSCATSPPSASRAPRRGDSPHPHDPDPTPRPAGTARRRVQGTCGHELRQTW